MEIVVDFSSFLEVEMKVGNKIELKSDDGEFKGIMEKEFFENIISRYLNAVDLSTVKAFVKHAEDIIKEEEEEGKKDEYIAKEIVS
jgi:hypothetical protein|nr:MAG TPA: hypothetical protein [Caudoviricetes sp.]